MVTAEPSREMPPADSTTVEETLYAIPPAQTLTARADSDYVPIVIYGTAEQVALETKSRPAHLTAAARKYAFQE